MKRLILLLLAMLFLPLADACAQGSYGSTAYAGKTTYTTTTTSYGSAGSTSYTEVSYGSAGRTGVLDRMHARRQARLANRAARRASYGSAGSTSYGSAGSEGYQAPAPAKPEAAELPAANSTSTVRGATESYAVLDRQPAYWLPSRKFDLTNR